jgi:2-keto-4-pentenoate hydratase
MTSSLMDSLWRARLDDSQISRTPPGAPADFAAAYALQLAFIDTLDTPCVGWKLGATSDQSMAMLGVDTPFIGPLLEKFCLSSGTDMALPRNQSPGIETEFTIRLGSALPPRETPYDRAAVDGAIDGIVPSFEIVASRLEGGPVGAGPMLAADFGANGASVMGSPCSDWSGLNLHDHPVTLTINGETVAEGSNVGLMWDHLFDAVVWLANHPALAGRGLAAGDLIMTGTCTGLLPIKPGDHAVADFGKIGRIETKFT